MDEDDVERLVGPLIECGEKYASQKNHPAVLLARIVRELLPAHFERKCDWSPSCPVSDVPPEQWCDACRARALRERLNRLARGEA